MKTLLNILAILAICTASKGQDMEMKIKSLKDVAFAGDPPNYEDFNVYGEFSDGDNFIANSAEGGSYLNLYRILKKDVLSQLPSWLGKKISEIPDDSRKHIVLIGKISSIGKSFDEFHSRYAIEEEGKSWLRLVNAKITTNSEGDIVKYEISHSIVKKVEK